MDIEQGLEIKIVYNRIKDPNQMVRLTVSKTHDLTITLGDGRCSFQGCPIGTLTLTAEQQYGETFILKIYRKDSKLRIDLNGNKNVVIDYINSGVQACTDFWGKTVTYKFQFEIVSPNLVTHYRMVTAEVDKGDDDHNKNIPGELHIEIINFHQPTREKYISAV